MSTQGREIRISQNWLPSQRGNRYLEKEQEYEKEEKKRRRRIEEKMRPTTKRMDKINIWLIEMKFL